MPIANRSSHGRHHSATGATLRQESSNDDKNDLNHGLRHSISPHSGQNGNGPHSMNTQHRPNIRKRPHSSRNGVIGHNSNPQNTNGLVPVQGANANDQGLDFVDLAVWAADVAPQISIPGDSSSALLAAAAAVTSSHGNLANRYSPVR